MGELIGIVVILGISYIMCKAPEWKFHNYMPPNGQMVDKNAMMLDKAKNGLSNEQVMKNTVNGKYNKKKDF